MGKIFGYKVISIFSIIQQMENRPRTTLRNDENRRISQPKFKNIKMQANELQSKYDIYKNGTPNIYQQDVQLLKVYHLKNDVKTLELPAIDYLLQEIKNIPPHTGTNQRDYNIHPSMIQKYGNKFRNLISDQQQIRDFLGWLSKKQKQILNKNCSQSDKFYLNQSLVASGFNEMLTQIAQVSKPRSQIMRMLWNKQNSQVQHIINLLHKQNTDSQRKNLQTIKSLHLGYQQQIIQLKSDNYCTQKKFQQANILNQTCLNTLRIMKKQIKKFEKVIKQLNQSNITLKQQALTLLKQNAALLMKQKGISAQQARILSYRSLQISSFRKKLTKYKGVKKVFKDIKGRAQSITENSQQHDLEEKKQKLITLIKKRMKQNPQQKTFILKGQFSDDQDEQINLDLQVQQLFKIAKIKTYLRQRNPNQIVSVFQQKQTNTDISSIDNNGKQKQDSMSIGVQTQAEHPDHSRRTVSNLVPSKQSEELDQIKKLKDKKIYQRHSLMLIEMNKMMQFKKIDNASKIRKLSRFSSINNPQMASQMNASSKNSRFQSQSGSQSSISEQSQSVAELDAMNYSGNGQKQHNEAKNRQNNVIRMHHESLLTQKSSQFQNMIRRISKQLKQSSISQDANQGKQMIPKHIAKLQEMSDKIGQFREIVKKFLSNKDPTKQITNNPQKYLKKILTDTYKNLYISNKVDFLSEMIRTAKHCYGNVIYENKLLHLISMIVEHKDKSLLSAICLLLNIDENGQCYEYIDSISICEIYYKIYFYLSIKNPTQNQFNIWGNYTNINKLSSEGFVQILSSYFNQSKCMYLQFKIRQFIGIGASQSIDGNYYVQLNPLMMYLLEVYLLEKKNYYQSYHCLIDFLSCDDLLDLQTFVFLMDLLCLKQAQQKQLIQTYFNAAGRTDPSGYCNKGVFYKMCVKYQLPLFEFINLLKLQQFKKLSQHVQTECLDIATTQKWDKVCQSLERRLKSRNKMTANLYKILHQLSAYIKQSSHLNNQSFFFLYRVIIYTAFS